MSFYVTFTSSETAIENGCTKDDVKLGPFAEFVQITYLWIRSGPEGDFLANYHGDAWVIEGDGRSYSDVIVTYEEEAAA